MPPHALLTVGRPRRVLAWSTVFESPRHAIKLVTDTAWGEIEREAADFIDAGQQFSTAEERENHFETSFGQRLKSDQIPPEFMWLAGHAYLNVLALK